MKVYLVLDERHAQTVLSVLGKSPSATERAKLGAARLAEEDAIDVLRNALLDGLAPARREQH